MVGNLHFVSTFTTILILDATCNISQRDHEISPVYKKIPQVLRVSAAMLPGLFPVIGRRRSYLAHFL